MKYQKAKELINSASPALSEMVKQYRAGTFRAEAEVLISMAKIDLAFRLAEDTIRETDEALSAFTARLVTYRGRDFTEAEQIIFQEFVTSRMDEIKATSNAELIRSESMQHMTDYSLVIGIESAFIRSIPGHTLTDAFDRFQRSTFSTATGVVATVTQVPQPDPVPSVNQHCQCSVQ
jgi:hypothetical protein